MDWLYMNGMYLAQDKNGEWQVSRNAKGFQLKQFGHDNKKIGPTYLYRGDDLDTILSIANGKSNAS